MGRKNVEICEPWQRIVEYPDNHLNDFCLFQDLDERWHAIGIMGTGTWESEVSLFHSSSSDLFSRFENHEPILVQNPPDGLRPQKHAPFVVIRDGEYHMFYRRPWGTIMKLVTSDPYCWDGIGEVVFEDLLVDGLVVDYQDVDQSLSPAGGGFRGWKLPVF